MAKKKVGKVTEKSKSSVATSKKAEYQPVNPLIAIGKITAVGMFLITISFLIFGGNIVYAIPITMGLVLLGIVLGLLAARKPTQ